MRWRKTTMAVKHGVPLFLATRISAYKEEGESWTSAVERYSRDVLMRHPRTVHRWLSGESPIPAVVEERLNG
jgi:hypothetical protein